MDRYPHSLVLTSRTKTAEFSSTKLGTSFEKRKNLGSPTQNRAIHRSILLYLSSSQNRTTNSSNQLRIRSSPDPSIISQLRRVPISHLQSPDSANSTANRQLHISRWRDGFYDMHFIRAITRSDIAVTDRGN